MPGKVKRLFPGGNTGIGFYSLYDQIADSDTNAIFILKGGPGVGKSSFIRWIGQELLARGYDIEELYCSSDNGSLDGVKAPAIGVTVLDGTAPHVVDPKNPGAVDSIIHLGDYWNEEGIRVHKAEIVAAIARNGFLFRRAYGYLRAAKNYNDELEAYIREQGALDVAGLNRLAAEVTSSIFTAVPVAGRVAKERHLFASAITPGGQVNYLPTIVGDLERRILIQGRPGSGRTTIVKKVLSTAVACGYDVEAYHCALSPERIDHVVIPELSVAVLNASEPHSLLPAANDWSIDTMQYVDWAKLAPYEHDILRLTRLYHEALDFGISLIGRAKQNHDQIEAYYVSAMDFAAVNERRAQLLERILEMAARVEST